MSSTTETARLADFIPDGGLTDPSEILDRFLAWVEGSGLEPYPAQTNALLELAADRHVILSTPTGSGKSLVALGLHFRGLCEGQRSFYTAPIKALVSEKFFALCDEFGPEKVGMLTGDASVNRSAPIVCCTAEVLSNMALQQGEKIDLRFVVMDEFHYYSDRDRGIAWQVPLLTQSRTQFLLMSATLGNTASIEERLRDVTSREVARVHSDDRPVPLDYAYRDTPILDTIESLLDEGRAPVYIVHFTQRDAAEQAQALTSSRITSRDERRALADAISGFRFDSPYGATVRRMLGHGIGLHHAGLLPKYRLLTQQLAQRGLLKVICGTDTLGVGVNIPIRTVLFSRLCKFDGEKVSLLSVRDFKQIAGRAGRKGFDERGSVVCQAPEHVIENKRRETRAASRRGRRKRAAPKKPPRGLLPWNAETFQQLRARPPETLMSRFRVSHGMLVSSLKAEPGDDSLGTGYPRLIELIRRCHEPARQKRQLRRQAAVLFRELRRSGILEVSRDEGAEAPRVHVQVDLQREFSLHHTLSLYLVEACSVLEPDSPTHTLDVLSVVEAILENPRAILAQQVRIARKELQAKLKARGVPYEERIAKLEALSWPRPNADFIYSTFNLFAEAHPWVASENVHPKSIAREMFENYSSFDDIVRRYQLARMEGLLLRYLNQVHSTLSRNIPEALQTEGVRDLIAYLRAVLSRVDSSLVEEWENLAKSKPPALADADPAAAPASGGRVLDTRELETRIRTELHLLVRALSVGNYAEAANCVRQDPDDPWDAARFEEALAAFFLEYTRIRFDPEARRAHLTLFKRRDARHWQVHQVLSDEAGDNLWNIEGEIDLGEGASSGDPLVRVQRIGV